MIQTLIEPSSLPVLDGLLAVRLSSSPPPHAATTAASTQRRDRHAELLHLVPPLHPAGGMIGASPVLSGRRNVAPRRPPSCGRRPFCPAPTERRAKLRHQPVPVPAVHGPDELHHLPSVALGGPLEEEGGRVHGHAEQLGLLRGGHRRLDRLDARGDRDAAALLQQLVEGVVGELLAAQVAAAARRGACSHSIAIVSSSARRRRVITQTSSTGEICRRWPSLAPARWQLEGDDAAAGAHPAARHVLAERGHGQRERDLRLGDVGAAAVAAQQQALADQLVDHGAQRRPRDAEVGRQAALGRQRVADLRARRASRGSRRARAPACCRDRWCARARSSLRAGH